MGVFDTALWKLLKRKAEEQAREEQTEPHGYLAAVEAICTFAVDRAKRTDERFPLFTLHDETHFCNVLRLMHSLLGDRAEALTRDEAAMLMLAACCHDLGMSCSKREMAALERDTDRLDRYLDEHPGDFVKVYKKGMDRPELTDDVRRNFVRSIHHERVEELLRSKPWPEALKGRVPLQNLIAVCRSHGEDSASLYRLEPTPSIDLRLCAVLLRLADLLDFDTSRAPQAIYNYYDFDDLDDAEGSRSRESWQRHLASHGFDFRYVDRRFPYKLPYSATCPSMQVEQGIRRYLDWVDRELLACGKLVPSFTERWRGLVLPGQVEARIEPTGYESGEYRLSLDQDKTLELLVGENLYSDPAVFVRELIQNAIDAVRTRQALDKDLLPSWRPQINIRTWTDDEGYHWFRIEDNGIGMTKEHIEKHLLKVGSSYYRSAAFEQEKLRRGVADYTPISRFGIGLLSCFMGDREHNRVELSTKHFERGSSALRLRMEGMSGYYFLTVRGQPGEPMPGKTGEEREPYRVTGGTALAVRTNLYQSARYRGFKEIVDKYVLFPPVPIHYQGDEGAFDYPTEQAFMDAVHAFRPHEDRANAGLLELPFTEEQKRGILETLPLPEDYAYPTVLLKLAALDRYTASPHLSGAALLGKFSHAFPDFTLALGETEIPVSLEGRLRFDKDEETIIFTLEGSTTPGDRLQQQVEQFKNVIGGISFSSPLEREVVSALLDGSLNDQGWRQSLQKHFLHKAAELEDTITAVCQRCADAAGVSPSALRCAFMLYHTSHFSKRNISPFPVCNLSRQDWFSLLVQSPRVALKENYWGDTTRFTGCSVHNGIVCGSSNFFLGTKHDNLCTVLLLKDEHRPGLSLARDDVRQLSPALAWELETLRRSLREEGFSLDYFDLEDAITAPPPSLALCEKLLERRPDLEARLRVYTDVGSFPLDELQAALREHPVLKLQGISDLSERAGQRGVYDSCLLTRLRQTFTLYVCFGETEIFDTKNIGAVILLTEKSDESDSRLRIFPPAFFLPPWNGSKRFLTCPTAKYRSAINAAHPLSVFLIENGKTLS